MKCRATHNKKIVGYLVLLLFCSMYLTEKVLRGSFMRKCYPKKLGPSPSGRKILQNQSVEVFLI